MKIRPYLKSDFDELVHLIQLNIPDYFAVEEKDDFIDYLKYHREDYFVVVENDKIIGCGGINYFPHKHLARISWDMIHPDFQGKGIGKKLTKYRLAHLKNKTDIHFVVVRTTQLVHKFYEKMGFTLEKTEKDFWTKGFDLYQMTLKIQ